MSYETGERKIAPASWQRDIDQHEDKYEDFYDRAFSTQDINDIYRKGGAITLDNFFSTSKENVKDKDYWRAMFPNEKKSRNTLGYNIFERFFKDETISKNKLDRLIVATGQKVEFNNKTYKGGMFLPLSYIQSRIKR